MSTNNIISTEVVDEGVIVTFRVHGRQGERSYLFDRDSGAAIVGGADPAGLAPLESDVDPSAYKRSGGGSGGGEVGAEVGDVAAGEVATDIGAIGAL
jgi:hypothetical protein